MADRHHGLTEGVRGLLATAFPSVFMVGDEPSLLRGAERLAPALIIIDITMAEGDLAGLLKRVASRTPGSKLLLLSVHDEASVAQAAMVAGADAFVLKRSIATDLLPAVETVLAGGQYVSHGISH
jgi:two-component system secretion response regulator SsrB